MTAVPHIEVTTHTFRNVLGLFCSGLTIVTAETADGPVGFTCQSFFSVSLDPPLVAFSAAKTSTSYARIRHADSFCINILRDGQEALCQTFARSGTDKWAQVSWRPGPAGTPVIDGVLAWIECRTQAEYEAGDHYLTLGRVVALAGQPDKCPLLYYRGSYAQIERADGECA
ncbi:flavin reductase family protein [Acrocarpospora macrocephala]|uniref:Monooxygenase n=1 Tax=Acrocarpospora macrocephala TaxID=150177 RepID=A0A5M3WFG7_9ACTN|nr:flavin reductase family protein [Acrocarpospora macrocephala]GES07079.1 monooxygenase [Acrocarpospora macrocephala]